MAKAELRPTHNDRLDLPSAYSSFYYEIDNSDRASRIAKSAFDDAMAMLGDHTLDKEVDRDGFLIQLRDDYI